MNKVYSKKTPYGFFETYFKTSPVKAYSCHQIHSTTIIKGSEKSKSEKADGLYLFNSELFPLAIKTADCLPIFFAGKSGISLIHAGWRGLANNIIGNPILKKLDIDYAFIGPSIGQNNYEVDISFLDHFQNAQNFSIKRNEQKFLFDLKAYATQQIQRNFGSIQIEDSGICTFENPTFASYRRDKSDTRNWNIFIPK